ncbi:MAG TPA: hypothetical protein VF914_21935 [Chloroflexia bacterium]
MEALAHSTTYQQTVEQLNATALLVGETSVEVFEVRGGFLDVEALAELVKGVTTR